MTRSPACRTASSSATASTRPSTRRAAAASTAVVMIMDLDHFKEINDTLGHHMGDLLLQEVSRRLRLALRESDTVARLGGDEFGVLLPRVESRRATRRRSPRTCSRTCASRSCSRACGSRSTPASASPCTRCTARTTRRSSSAPTSRCTPPSSPAAASRIFEPELDRHSPRRLALAGGMRQAINEGQIQLYYQPKADLRTGRIMGVEALARWDHPEFGIVGPSEFVPIAEQTGLITPLTSFVLDAAIAPGPRVEGRRPGALGRRQPLRPLVPGHAAGGRDPAPARQAGTSRPSCSSSRSPRACS